MVKAKYIKVAATIIGLHLQSSWLVFADQDKKMDVYLEGLSTTAVTVYCTADWFLDEYKLSKKACIDALTDLSDICTDVIRPIAPDIYAIDDKKLALAMFRSLSKIYSYCLMSEFADSQRKE